MKTKIPLSCVSLLALTLTFAAAQEVRRGSIVSVDEQAGSITIRQTASGAADMERPPDKFAVQDGLLFNAVREGDKVTFTSKEVSGTNIITQLQKD